MSTKEDLNGNESREPDHNGEDEDQLEEKEEEETEPIRFLILLQTAT
jgi:hypothetical protein